MVTIDRFLIVFLVFFYNHAGVKTLSGFEQIVIVFEFRGWVKTIPIEPILGLRYRYTRINIGMKYYQNMLLADFF